MTSQNRLYLKIVLPESDCLDTTRRRIDVRRVMPSLRSTWAMVQELFRKNRGGVISPPRRLRINGNVRLGFKQWLFMFQLLTGSCSWPSYLIISYHFDVPSVIYLKLRYLACYIPLLQSVYGYFYNFVKSCFRSEPLFHCNIVELLSVWCDFSSQDLLLNINFLSHIDEHTGKSCTFCITIWP